MTPGLYRSCCCAMRAADALERASGARVLTIRATPGPAVALDRAPGNLVSAHETGTVLAAGLYLGVPVTWPRRGGQRAHNRTRSQS